MGLRRREFSMVCLPIHPAASCTRATRGKLYRYGVVRQRLWGKRGRFQGGITIVYHLGAYLMEVYQY